MSGPLGRSKGQSPFYRKVMGLKTKSLKVRGRPKYTKMKKAGAVKEKSVKRLFRVFAGNDADFFQNKSKQQNFFKDNLKGLSKKKLNEIRKRVFQLVQPVMECPETRQEAELLLRLTDTYIERKIQKSERALDQLKKKMIQKLKKFKKLRCYKGKNGRRYVGWGDEQMLLKRFVRKELANFVEAYEKQVNLGKIVRERYTIEGVDVITDAVEQLLVKSRRR